MPANCKYLSSTVQRIVKLTCGLIGGYVLSYTLHLFFGSIIYETENYLATSIVSVYLLWGSFFLIPYLFENGWKVWLFYLVLSSVFFGGSHLYIN